MAFGPEQQQEKPVYICDHAIEEDYLIVYVDVSINVVFAINLDSVARFPIQLKYEELLAQVDSESIILFDIDWPKEVLMDMDSLPEWRQNKSVERYDAIQPLLDDFDSVLRNGYGQHCFEKAIKLSGRSKQYVYDCFYGFLRMGQRRAGLSFPIGKNTTHIPKKRELRVKAGRPNKGIARGKVLDEYDLNNFMKGKRLFTKRNGPSIQHTYKTIIRKHYYDSRYKQDPIVAEKTGRRFKVTLLPADKRPSYGQFYYWLVKEFGGNIPLRNKSRQNAIENRKDNAGRTGDGRQNIIAPGQVFEIDETPFPEELVSVFDPMRSTKIGKATLYFIIDVFSKLIIGLFITTENPSYNTVRQAIFNGARDKQKWFEELGLNFDAKYWPEFGLGSTYLVDKAEFHNKLSEGPIADLPTSIKFTRSGRGDDKPNIEQLFHIFQKYFEGVSRAHQTKSQQDIARQLARKNACLTIPELYQIAIVYVLFHNNNRRLKVDTREREMKRDGVEAVPVKIWNWGMTHRPGYLLNVPDEELYIKLLPKGEVTVHREGLYLKEKGLWYNCEWTLGSGLQERKLPNQRCLTLPCRYNQECVDIILISVDYELKVATLDHRHSSFSGLSFSQVKHQKDAEYTENELAFERELEYQLGVQLFVEQKLTHANNEKVSSPVPNLSKIKDNRKVEALANRVNDMNRYLYSLQNQIILQQDTLSDEHSAGHKGHAAFDEEEDA